MLYYPLQSSLFPTFNQQKPKETHQTDSLDQSYHNHPDDISSATCHHKHSLHEDWDKIHDLPFSFRYIFISRT